MRTFFLSTLPLGISVLIVMLLLSSKPETRAELQPETVTRVIAKQIRAMDLKPINRLTGKLQPARESELRFELSGNIVARTIEPGYRVKTGEVLLALDAGDFEDRVSEAEARLKQEIQAIARDKKLLKLLREQRELQEREVERLERLGKDSLASKSNYDNALRTLIQLRSEEASLAHNVETSSSRKAVLSAGLEQAKRNLRRSQLLAPYNGTINKVYYEQGDYARAGDIAVEIVQLSPLDLYLEVTGDQVSVLEIGQIVPVNIDEQTLDGEIVAIQSNPQPETLTHGIRIRMEGEQLFPGELAEVELPGKEAIDVPAIPLTAVMYQEGKAYVFQILNDELLRVPVELLTRQGDWQGISGLTPGTLIVAQDVAVLSDKQKVAVDLSTN